MSRPRLAGVALVVAWTALTFMLSREWRVVESYPPQAAYVRVENWLKSARCVQWRGAFLATCTPDDPLEAIEETQGADDLGHVLLADVIAWGRTPPVTTRTLTRLNLLLNALGLVGLSVALWWAGFRVVAVLAVFVGLRWGIPGPNPGPDTLGSIFAAYCLAWVPVLWVSTLDLDRVDRRRWLVGGVLSVLSLTWAVLLRQPIGLAGLAGVLALLAWRALGRRPLNPRRIGSCAVLALALLLPTQAARGLVALRTQLSEVPPGSRLISHGISHNLYIGLGVYPNPWGIEWLDDSGYNAAWRIDRSIPFASPTYFRTLWRLYLHIVWHDPLGVARVYWRKAGETIRYQRLSAQLPAAIVLLGSAWWWVPRGRRAGLSALTGSLILVVLVLLQGVLARPGWTFFYPAVFGVQVVMLGVLELAGRTLFDRWRSA